MSADHRTHRAIGHIRAMTLLAADRTGSASQHAAEDASLRAELHRACARGDASAARELLARGARHDGTFQEGSTLHVACQQGDAACVALLVEARASLSAIDAIGRTPLHAACAAGHADAARALLAPPAGAPPAAAPPTAAPQLLDARDQMGVTPLHAAVRHGHAACVRLLLDAGASTRAHRRANDSLLHVACRFGHAGAARALLRARSEPDAVSELGMAPLHLAAHRGHARVVAALLDARASVDGPPAPPPSLARRVLGARSLAPPVEPPCHWAADGGHLALCQWLAARGARRASAHGLRCLPDNPAARWLRETAEWSAGDVGGGAGPGGGGGGGGRSGSGGGGGKHSGAASGQLMYLEFLCAAEVIPLLRAGAEIGAADARGAAPTALSIALAVFRTRPEHGAAAAVVAAALPWSARTHHLWPALARKRARDLLVLGCQLAAARAPAQPQPASRRAGHTHAPEAGGVRAGGGGLGTGGAAPDGRAGGSGAPHGGALLDVWVEHIMPLALPSRAASCHRDCDLARDLARIGEPTAARAAAVVAVALAECGGEGGVCRCRVPGAETDSDPDDEAL